MPRLFSSYQHRDLRFLLAVFVSGVIAASSAFYLIPNALKTDDPEFVPTFGDALYFSLVTVTTVGYGDIAPSGFGRVLVGIETLFGLLMAGLFINALWERQSERIILKSDSRVLQEYIEMLGDRLQVHLTAIAELVCGDELDQPVGGNLDYPFSNLEFGFSDAPRGSVLQHGGSRFAFYFASRDLLVDECRALLTVPLRAWDRFSDLRHALLAYYKKTTTWSNVRRLLEEAQTDQEWRTVICAWIRSQTLSPDPLAVGAGHGENDAQFAAIARYNRDLIEEIKLLRTLDLIASGLLEPEL
ncbi:MAG: two pore domain potassium channel family protein [Planctomycetales bacterium]|nr:two pore domain potassium channel family protein [Planctomycetales bacterium]